MITGGSIRPPGRNARSQTSKKVPKYSAPTASSISIETIASYVPSDVAIVAQLDVDQVLEARRADPLAGERVLLARDRDRRHAAAEFARGIQREAAPPGPELQDVLAGSKPGFDSDEPVLIPLRVGERWSGVSKTALE